MKQSIRLPERSETEQKHFSWHIRNNIHENMKLREESVGEKKRNWRNQRTVTQPDETMDAVRKNTEQKMFA